MSELKITRNSETTFTVQSGPNTYTVTANPWRCTCPATRMCKHIRTVAGNSMPVGETVTVPAMTEHVDTIDDCIDLGRHPSEIREEISAARRGRAAYRRFLGY